MDLLLVIDGNKSHYVYIRECFSSKNVLTEHKEVWLSVNGAQSLRLEKETIKLKNYFKRILVPF